MKRVATEHKTQEQLDHITITLVDLQLQLLNKDTIPNAGSDSILGGYGSPIGGKMVQFRTMFTLFYLELISPNLMVQTLDLRLLSATVISNLYHLILDSRRVYLAYIHFEGNALSWFQNLNMGDITITWKQFVEVVFTRFEDLSVFNIIVEFNKLKMTGSFEDYVERFDELRTCLLMEDNNRFSEEYFIASFLSGWERI